jgi:hypothetical protein
VGAIGLGKRNDCRAILTDGRKTMLVKIIARSFLIVLVWCSSASAQLTSLSYRLTVENTTIGVDAPLYYKLAVTNTSSASATFATRYTFVVTKSSGNTAVASAVNIPPPIRPSILPAGATYYIVTNNANKWIELKLFGQLFPPGTYSLKYCDEWSTGTICSNSVSVTLTGTT